MPENSSEIVKIGVIDKAFFNDASAALLLLFYLLPLFPLFYSLGSDATLVDPVFSERLGKFQGNEISQCVFGIFEHLRYIWNSHSVRYLVRPNGQAQVQGADEIPLARSKVAPTHEQGKTDTPLVT